MKPISHIKTPFIEKFGTPRQGNLVSDAIGTMSFPKDDFHSEAFRGIEESSHLWLIFEFHQVPDGEFNGLVRPPRFENKKKMGVYATRSPHRPNRIGMSLVKFEKLVVHEKEIVLTVSGVDLVDGTPILDIKPYVPYADTAVARSPFEKPEKINVVWKCEAPGEKELIENVIALDPRPGQDKDSGEEYGISIAGYNVRFKYSVGNFEIISAIRLK